MNEELKAAIKKFADSEEQADKIINGISDLKLIVRSVKEQSEYESRLLEEKKDSLVADAVKEAKKDGAKEAKSAIEKDIKKLTGIAQQPGEPTHKYQERAITEIRGAGEKTEELLARIEKVEEEAAEKIKVKDDEIAKLEKSIRSNSFKTKLDKAFNELEKEFNIDPEKTPGYKMLREMNINVLSETVEQEGDVLYITENGKIKKDDNFLKIDVVSHLKDRFKEFKKEKAEEPENKNQGPNKKTNKKEGDPKGKIDVENITEKFTSMGEVVDFLNRKGVAMGDERDELFASIIEKQGITQTVNS